MNRFIIILFLMTITSASFAATNVCKGSADSHSIEFKQIGDDVQLMLENKDFYKCCNVGTAVDGKYKVSAKFVSIFIVHQIDLSVLMKKPELAQDVLVKMILGRPEFRGEEDMIYSYASDFFHSLKCD